MIYLAVFFGSGGYIPLGADGAPEPEQIGLFKNENQAIQQAESKYEARHIRGGVCMLSEETRKKDRFGLTVVSLRDFVKEYKPQ